MLGNKIIDSAGKMTNRRVLPSDGPLPKFETSFELTGTILGQNAKTLVTYWSMIRPDGTLYGECPSQGLIMTENGESATFRATGAGNFPNKAGAVAFRGAIYHETASEGLSALNGLAVIYEWEVDEEGNTTFQGWEWT